MRNAIIAPGRHGAPGGKSVVADVTLLQSKDWYAMLKPNHVEAMEVDIPQDLSLHL